MPPARCDRAEIAVGYCLRSAGESFSMKRVLASVWMCWAAYCGYQSNTIPLAFGMTLDEAALALGVPLYYYSGHHGSEIYVAYGQAGLPRAYPVASAIALQFRGGHLTGWKKDWRLRRF
jgi:hypothetical protein